MKNLSAKLTCAVTAVALILSFVAYLSLDDSLAWFSNNKEVTAQGMSVSVKAPSDYKVEIASFGVLDINGTIYTYDPNDEQLYTLPTYDVQNISYSKYSKALVVVITVTSLLDTPKDLSVKLETDPAHDKFNWDDNNWFSNCMQITPADISTDTDGTAVTTTGKVTQSFLTVQTDGSLAKNETAVTDGLDLGTISVAAGQTVTAYYVIEYDDNFVTKLTTSTDPHGEMTYSNDIEFVIG